NIEQTSSEKTALYKSSLVSGNTLVDITGGLGVDSYYFAKVFNEVTHCEIDPELSQIAAYNFQALEQHNINCQNVDGMAYIRTCENVDCIYLDPSRRDQTKKKVFLLQDCTPDITEIYPPLLRRAPTILVKVSPLVDISKAIQDVKQINEIHIVAVDNQVKEMLLLLTKEPSNTLIRAVNIKSEATEEFRFDYAKEFHALSNYTPPLLYLY